MMHRSRSRVVAWIFAGIVAVSAASFSSSARADALDCLTDAAKVAFDPSKLKDAIEFQAKYGQCNAYLANPTPTFAITLSLVAGAMATGILPTDAEECINAIPNAGSKLLLAAIDAFGLPVPDKLKSELKSESQNAYNKVLNDFPVLAAVADMFNCACAIAAFGKDAAKDFFEAADSCGEVIGDIAGVFVTLGGATVEGFEGLVQSGGCLITAWFGGCAGSAPGSYDPCYGASCPTGQQCFPPALAAQYPKLTKNPDPQDHKQNCGSCGAVPHGVGLAPAKCGCSGGFVGSYEFNYYGPDQKALKSCTCPAPFSAYYLTKASTKGWSGKWTCACPVGKKLIDGKCDLTCQLDQQATPKDDTSKVLAGKVWSCQACLPGTTSDGKGPCRPLCGPNEHLVTDKTQEVASKLPDIFGINSTKITQSCKACPAGTKSDGKGPCIACADENSLVAGGLCYTCKPWQKVHLASIQAGGSTCNDICPNGVLVDPNAPPALSLKSGAPQSVKATAPGASGQGGSGGNVSAKPSAPSRGTSGDQLVATPTLVPMCVPCGVNEYAKDNKCHDCGPKAVANSMLAAKPGMASSRCVPCQGRQVAKLISGVMTCAADCSSVGGSAKGRASANHIVDPKDTARCIACPKGSVPNDAHTACVTTASLPHSPGTLKLAPNQPGRVPGKRKIETKGGAVGKVPSCPPRMHPNPSGTGCLPDVDMPGMAPGSGPHQGTGPSGRSRGR